MTSAHLYFGVLRWVSLSMDRWPEVSLGRKRSSPGGTLVFAAAAVACVGADYRSTDRDAFLSRFGGRGGKRRHQYADAGYLSKRKSFRAHDVICHAGHYDSAVNMAPIVNAGC